MSVTKVQPVKELTALEAARALVKKLEIEDYNARRERDKIKQTAWREFKDNHTHVWTVKPMKRDLWFQGVTVEGLFIASQYLESEYKAFVEKWGEFEVDGGRPKGMFYYRTSEGILTCDGGGTYVLRAPVLCSDQQWAMLERGEIPESFVHESKR